MEGASHGGLRQHLGPLQRSSSSSHSASWHARNSGVYPSHLLPEIIILNSAIFVVEEVKFYQERHKMSLSLMDFTTTISLVSERIHKSELHHLTELTEQT